MLKSTGYTLFESGPVRPLALTPDGSTLLVANAPDNRLDIYDVSTATPQIKSSIPVGLEPVAVALSGSGQAWVVNHLSDSVSIVDLNAQPARVTQTLWVGDEPRDIVFAGSDRERAFVTTAHRGQNAPYDPQLLQPSIGRADVWVFDATSPGAGAGAPLTIVSLFGDTPRPLAVTPDKRTVYAGIFNSGNRTTVLANDVRNGGLDKPGPTTSVDGVEQPVTGLIVKYNGSAWMDSGDPVTGDAPKDWSDRVRFSLPDYDVFAIDATLALPSVTARIPGVGTTLFAMAVRPTTGELFVATQEARNEHRFEGTGTRGSKVNGHFVESRVAIIEPDQSVRQRHLNKHITSYDAALGTQAERDLSLAIPSSIVLSSDGSKAYIAAYGSQAVGVFDAAKLADDSFERSASDMVALTAGGASGLVLDETRSRLYVLTRFDNGISMIDTATRSEVAHARLFNPESESITTGRPVLYDAHLSSSRGDSACAGCHVFGDMDQLAWDLGNPDGSVAVSPNTYTSVTNVAQRRPTFHPLKGPMTTQSLRGLKDQGPMHWRGDRTGQSHDEDETINEQAFQDFNVAFVDLLGRDAQIDEAQMDAFTRFTLQITYPPNPIRHLDNSLTTEQSAGREFFFNTPVDAGNTCNACHVLDPEAAFFGSSTLQSAEGPTIDEDFKIPHLRNQYQKVGMFGSTEAPGAVAPNMGDQVRGFGFSNDGSADTAETFLGNIVFRFPDDESRREVVSFVYAFDSDLAPIVGQQATYQPNAPTAIRDRINLLVSRAMVITPRRECDLIAKVVINNQARGYVMADDGRFLPDSIRLDPVSLDALLTQIDKGADNRATFTCTPPGSGARIGVDHNANGVLDADES
jgi:DNA-binding beta-propeller fold protein YncE